MAKDVVTFLNWAAEPEHDERKKTGLKAVILFSALTAISLYVKRHKWSYIKSRKICEYIPLQLRYALLISVDLSSLHSPAHAQALVSLNVVDRLAKSVLLVHSTLHGRVRLLWKM